jgi:hypothetical protein
MPDDPDNVIAFAIRLAFVGHPSCSDGAVAKYPPAGRHQGGAQCDPTRNMG